MAQDHGLCRKKGKKSTDARAATAGPRCSCQQDSPYNLQQQSLQQQDSPYNLCVDPGAHGNEQGGGQSKTERGKNDEEGSGHGMAKVAAGKQSRQNKAAAGGHSRRTIRPAQASKKQQPAVGRPRSKTTAADDVGRPLAVQCRSVEGVRWCWPLRRRAQTYLPVSLPPIAFACHRPYPLP